ncbi:SMP-30/gluconolactonase/LRE family protein [Roseomonas sp. E05]|uniref:SMP-30/gluconolactonase/LRE family protein n=1 Tax=Roseomonas sp. E05 TaxID=3046310 RepID=UPI0024B88013|nr:SMP-30/gluconolactonase/LRE family protein [Roseomonas sp. E05]MDJ0386683.1 SMP-30/gluconolactonase/LRE family protein [Roseomonas sp. E05]
MDLHHVMPPRRAFIGGALGTLVAAPALAQRDYGPGIPPQRYPDPDILVLDPKRFKAKLGNAAIRRLHTGMGWAEGPAWHANGRFLVWSDIPNNTCLRMTAEDEHVSQRFRSPSGFTNGNTFDREGRQVSCRHLQRDVARYEPDGRVTVLAAKGPDGEFNAPNDVVVHPEDGSIWFTDPGYGALVEYEGHRYDTGSPRPFIKEAVYRIDGQSGEVTKVADQPFKPNGLCFSPDYRMLYVADTGSSHYPEARNIIWAYDVEGASLRNPRTFADMTLDGKSGLADGIRCDTEGNVWSSAGWVGEGYDGVHVFAPDGTRIGQIRLPEICSNVCFGGTRRNHLFMTASQSLYMVPVEARGAHFC